MARSVGRERPPGHAAGAVGTLVIHGAAVVLLFVTVHAPPPPGPEPIAVDLVAAPAPAPKARVAPEAIPTPPVEKPVPIKPPPPKAKPKPKPKAVTPPPKPRPADPVDREPPPQTQAPMTPAAGETPSTGNDAATVKTPGKDFPYPEYLRNLLNQVYQRWDRSSDSRNLAVEVSFDVLSDGAVRNILISKKSGSYAFDLGAKGAIEAAGTARAFGPLPKGWPSEVLPISILFKPTRAP